MSDTDHSTASPVATLPTLTRPASPPPRPLPAAISLSAPPPQQPVTCPSPFTAAVIFLHGVGSSGDELRSQLSHLVQPTLEQRFPHIRFLYPTAPLRSFTAFKGRVLPAWFDRAGYGLQWEEDVEGLRESCGRLNEVVRQCNAEGISNQRVIVGGFSMGGAQAIHAAYSDHGATSPFFHPTSTSASTAMPVPLAGCFCIASYLPRSCLIPSSLSSDCIALATPLFFMHGSSDSIVRPSWAEETCGRMKAAGVLCLFNMYERQMHALSPAQIDDLTTFIAQFLPRDVKSQPALPIATPTPTPPTSQQQQEQQQQRQQQPQQQHQQHQQQQQQFVQQSNAAEESKLKFAHRAGSPGIETSSGESAGVSAYLETLKPHNSDLR